MRCGTVRGLCLAGMIALTGLAVGMQEGYQPSLVEGGSLVGQEIRGSDGQTIGTLEELIVDSRQNKLAYAIVSADEQAMSGGESYLVSWDRFEVQSDGRSVQMTLDVDENQLQQMPTVDADADMNELQNAIRESSRPQGAMQGMQSRGQQRQVRGEITRLQTQRINNQRMMVAEIETQDGRTQQVILGSPDQLGRLDLQEGDSISVQGSPTRFQGKSAIQADQIRADGQQVRIRPQGQQDSMMKQQGRQSQEPLGQKRRPGGYIDLGESERGGVIRYRGEGDADTIIIYDGDSESDGEGRPRSRRQGRSSQPYRKLTLLIGMDVQDQQEEVFGSLEDVIVDTREGRIVYGILSYGGVFGVGESMAAVPWNSLQVMEQEEKIALNAQQDKLERFAYRQGDIRRLEDPQYSRRIHEAFNEEPYWVIYGYAPAGEQDRMQGKQDRQRAGAWSENSRYSRAFDPDNTQDYSGTVQNVGSFRPQPGAMEGLRLRIRTDDGQTHIVYAGPRAYVRGQNFRLRQGDQVEITASESQLNNRQVLIASEIRKDGQRLELFDDQGKPAWSTQDLMQQPGNGNGNGEQEPSKTPPPSNGEQQGDGESQQGEVQPPSKTPPPSNGEQVKSKQKQK